MTTLPLGEVPQDLGVLPERETRGRVFVFRANR